MAGALLRRLARDEERSLDYFLERAPTAGSAVAPTRPATLDRRTRSLVELAALLVVDAPTDCLRWAAERAAATGADDHMLVYVLETTAVAAGTVQAVASAPRLALAMDLDTEVSEGG